ncbi:MAG: Maf family protein [Pseudomonadota bacterium]
MSGNPRIYLASQSPRRRELLHQIGVSHAVLKVAVDETRRSGEAPQAYVARVALDKARAGRGLLGRAHTQPVLAADTSVVCAGEVLGKPAGRDAGLAMLACLSGTTHEVLSAVAMAGAAGEAVRVSSSRVTFRTLTARECAAYWATGEPADKAGAYAVQGLAAAFITRIEGSYSGVMGLPLYETAELLKEYGITVL